MAYGIIPSGFLEAQSKFIYVLHVRPPPPTAPRYPRPRPLPPLPPPPLSSRRCLPAPHPCRFAIPIIGSNGTVDYVAAAAILASHVQGAVGALMPCFPRATVAFGAP